MKNSSFYVDLGARQFIGHWDAFMNSLSDTGFLLLCSTTIYLLWRERNSRLHEGLYLPASVLFKQLDRCVKDVILARIHPNGSKDLLNLWCSWVIDLLSDLSFLVSLKEENRRQWWKGGAEVGQFVNVISNRCVWKEANGARASLQVKLSAYVSKCSISNFSISTEGMIEYAIQGISNSNLFFLL
ncbi:hypothetical protein YC2023_083965 [Brassica napus]